MLCGSGRGECAIVMLFRRTSKESFPGWLAGWFFRNSALGTTTVNSWGELIGSSLEISIFSPKRVSLIVSNKVFLGDFFLEFFSFSQKFSRKYLILFRNIITTPLNVFIICKKSPRSVWL